MMSTGTPSEAPSSFQAIVLAGGKGIRLAPYTATLPKPLMPIGDMPVLEVLLRQLRRHGVTDIILAVSHLGHLVQAYFGDGRPLGLRLSYSFEQTPLGTAGPIGTVLDRLGEHFIVANGDLLTTLDISALLKAHMANSADATIGVFEREWRLDFGLIDVDPEMRFRDYHEKPAQRHLVSMGIYVLRREAIRDVLGKVERLDMPDLILRLRDAGRTVKCHLADCFWLDIGRPDDLAAAQEVFGAEPSRFLGQD